MSSGNDAYNPSAHMSVKSDHPHQARKRHNYMKPLPPIPITRPPPENAAQYRPSPLKMSSVSLLDLTAHHSAPPSPVICLSALTTTASLSTTSDSLSPINLPLETPFSSTSSVSSSSISLFSPLSSLLSIPDDLACTCYGTSFNTMPAVTERLEQVFRAHLLQYAQADHQIVPPHPSGPQKTKTRWEHVDYMLLYIDKYLKSLGFFFEIILTDVPRGDSDPRTTRHRSTLSRWLSGDSVFRPVQLVQSIYQHRYSVPKARSKYSSELVQAFDGNYDLQAIRFAIARPGPSIWALQLSACRCAMEIGKVALTPDAEFQAHLQAAANPRKAGERSLVTEEDLLNFSTERSARVLQSRAPAVWFLTEWMAGTRKNGAFIVRPYRPHPLVCSESH